jgi:vacuolar protein sorting-associated protein 13A/C
LHYKQAASSKFLLLLGSAHFIGSPITLVESIGTGFWDLWYEPAVGLTHSPQAFAEGVERGTRSMLSKTVYGFAKSASEITGSISNVTAQLSFDPAYIEERDRERKQQAQHVGEGLAYGMWDFGKGVFDGVTGIVTRPVVGAQKEGTKGFFKGVGQALTGVVVKPISGTFDMVSRITEGVKNSANRAAHVERVRMPRFIGSDGVIPPFDGSKAEGQEILWRLKDGLYQNENYVFHFPPLDAMMKTKAAPRMTRILASNRHLFCVKGIEPGAMQVSWKCSLLGVSSLKRSEKNGLIVELKTNPVVELKAPAFYSYELSYIVLVLQRQIKEAQGQRDAQQFEIRVSEPEIQILPEDLEKEEEEEEDEDFVKL